MSWPDGRTVARSATAIDGGSGLANFADAPDPLHVCYTDVQMSYDTRDVVNDLTVVDHGRTLNDQSEWVADDTTTQYVDQASVNAWGARRGEIHMSLNSPSGELADRADDVLIEHSDPASASPR